MRRGVLWRSWCGKHVFENAGSSSLLLLTYPPKPWWSRHRYGVFATVTYVCVHCGKTLRVCL